MTEDQREEIIFYLRLQPHYSVDALREYLNTHDGVVYQSKQSYYDLLAAGGLSWHQTQAKNPNRDEPQVWRRGEEIKKN